MAPARPTAIFHALPAGPSRREVTADVIDGPQSVVSDQPRTPARSEGADGAGCWPLAAPYAALTRGQVTGDRVLQERTLTPVTCNLSPVTASATSSGTRLSPWWPGRLGGPHLDNHLVGSRSITALGPDAKTGSAGDMSRPTR